MQSCHATQCSRHGGRTYHAMQSPRRPNAVATAAAHTMAATAANAVATAVAWHDCVQPGGSHNHAMQPSAVATAAAHSTVKHFGMKPAAPLF